MSRLIKTPIIKLGRVGNNAKNFLIITIPYAKTSGLQNTLQG